MSALRWIGISAFALVVAGCAGMGESPEPDVSAAQPLANAGEEHCCRPL